MLPLVNHAVLTDINGRGSATVSLQHGIRVNPGVTLCSADVNTGSANAFATVHGYFAPNE